MRTNLFHAILFIVLLAGIQSEASPSLYFLENKGQIRDQYFETRKDIDFQLSTGRALQIFVGSGRLHYQWNRPEKAGATPPADDAGRVYSYRMDVELLGANTNAFPEQTGVLPYYEIYYTGQLAGARANAYRSITYRNVYPGIDWIIYINREEKMEYDFRVHPRGNVKDIRIRFHGTNALTVNEDGSLTAVTPMGSITEQAPVSFQKDGRAVSSRFVLETEQTLRFEVASYEGELTIDPVLEWSSYFGGGGSDLGRFTACDTKGFVYMTGSTGSASNIATTGAHQVTFGSGVNDAFLLKADSSGAKIWATYYGGNGDDQGWSVACDEADQVYMVGQTASSSGIAVRGHQNTYGAGASDAFIAKFNGDGVLSWASYYGGSAADEGWGVVCNKKGYIYVTGRAASKNNIATDATVHKDQMDAFLLKMDTAGKREWGTYLGGEGAELTWAIAADAFDNVYISGETGSATGMATAGAHQTQMTAANGSEAFIARYKASGTLVWCTYYGGNQPGQVFGTGIACDLAGNVIATGYTQSEVDIATAGSHQPQKGQGYDSYLVKFDSLGKRIWGTYYGGNNIENGYGVATDRKGNIFITGYTTSKENIATKDAIQTAPSTNASNDFYIAKFNKDGVLIWGSYYGAAGYDAGMSIAHDQERNIYVTGFANSGGLGTSNAFQANPRGSFEGLLMRLSECVIAGIGSISGDDSVCATSIQVYHVPAISGATGYTWQLPDGWNGSSTTDSITVTVGSEGGTIKVFAYNECDTTVITDLAVVISALETPIVSVKEFELSTQDIYDSYQWLLNGEPVEGAVNSTYTVTENGDYRVVVTSKEGCRDTSAVYHVSNIGSSIADTDRLAAELAIYPNPAGNLLNISSPFAVRTRLVGLDGKLVLDAGYNKVIDLHNVAEGIYFLSVYRQGQLVAVKKLTVIH